MRQARREGFVSSPARAYISPMTRPIRREAPAQGGSTGWALFSTVALLTDQTSWEGESVPAGASGTVVEVLTSGEAYIVDVVEPFDAVVTVRGHELEADDGR